MNTFGRGRGEEPQRSEARLTEAYVTRCRALHASKAHTMVDPLATGSRRTCQWCYYNWVAAGLRGEERPKRGPQTKEVIHCVECNVRLCSASCWNAFHDCVPYE